MGDREYYFEARSGGAVYIGHVRAGDEDAAREQARVKYPQASSIKVAMVDVDRMLERFTTMPAEGEDE